MSPNPSKVMAPVQMQSSPSQIKSRDKITDYVTKSNGREKANRGKTRANVSKERSGQASPKFAQSVQKSDSSIVGGQTPHSQSTRLKSASPPLKSGQSYNGRKSISPDGSYAGAKFSEAPTPDRLPMPPKHWLRSSSAGKSVEKTHQKAYVSCNAESGFEKITRDLKMMLKVES